jgi:ADP-ribose pyrophosphatase YjhB (NUDIX family)
MEPAGWLSDAEYRHVREILPILCVDVLPWRDTETGREIGLIVRGPNRGGPALTLIGGRVLRDETLEEAVRRHVAETLGDDVSVELHDPSLPLGVFEYFPDHRRAPFVDPDKHAVAVTYAGRLVGAPRPAGEAARFEWHPVSDLPPVERFGFGHGEVTRRLVPRLG